jgi:hypothetical protein
MRQFVMLREKLKNRRFIVIALIIAGIVVMSTSFYFVFNQTETLDPRTHTLRDISETWR